MSNGEVVQVDVERRQVGTSKKAGKVGVIR
jgi:hypothetical protein